MYSICRICRWLVYAIDVTLCCDLLSLVCVCFCFAVFVDAWYLNLAPGYVLIGYVYVFVVVFVDDWRLKLMFDDDLIDYVRLVCVFCSAAFVGDLCLHLMLC